MAVKLVFTFVFLCFFVISGADVKMDIHAFGKSITDEVQSLLKAPNDDRSIILYLKVISARQFANVKSSFKDLLAETATVYCRDILMLQLDLSGEKNIAFDESNCPEPWPKSDQCISGNLMINFDKEPHYLNSINLRAVWDRTKKSPKIKQLSIQEYEIPESNNYLIMVLVGIIVVLLSVLIVLLYIFRQRVFYTCFHKRDSNKSVDNQSWAYQNNEIYEMNYPHPPVYTPAYDDKYIQPIQTQNPGNTYITVLETENAGRVNRGYEPDKNFKYNPESAKNNNIDDFDSDEDIVFPSPLTAPPLPPRPCKHDDGTPHHNNNKTMHYMCSPITS